MTIIDLVNKQQSICAFICFKGKDEMFGQFSACLLNTRAAKFVFLFWICWHLNRSSIISCFSTQQHTCMHRERERERAGATSCTWQHAVFQSVSGKRWSAAFSPLKAAAAEIPAEWLLFTHFSFGQADGSFHSPVYAQWRLNTCKTISSVFRQPIILSFVYFYLTRFGV